MNIKSKILLMFKKKAVKNGMWMYLLQIFNTIIPFLTLPYITRILGPTKYGEFSVAINIFTYLQVIVEYGFGMSATREVALTGGDKLKIDKLFTRVLLSRTLLFFISFLISIIYIVMFSDNYQVSICLIILTVSLLGSCIQQNWLFQGLQDMKYISAFSMVSRLISVILIFVFVRSSKDLFLYCVLYSISPCFSGLLGLIIAIKKYKVHIISIKIYDIISELKSGWYIFTTSLSSKVFGAIGITFLAFFATDTIVGIYSAIQKIPTIMMYAWTPISQVLYPICSKKMDESFKDGKVFVYHLRKIILPFFVVMAFCVAIFARQIVEIAFGAQYVTYYKWIIPLLLWMVVAINNNFLGIQILLGGGYDKEYSKCFQIGVILTILFNLVLIYFFGGLGAAIAPVLSECILSIILKISIKRLERDLGDRFI